MVARQLSVISSGPAFRWSQSTAYCGFYGLRNNPAFEGIINKGDDNYLNSFDESIYETMGEGLAYRVFWTRFGQGALLALLASHGTPSASPQASRQALCRAFSETLRALHEEMLFPFPPAMPPGAAKTATAAFHKTFHHLEEEFWSKAGLLLPELVPVK